MPSPSNFQLIIDALGDYANQTGIDLSNYPFAEKLQLLSSPDDILGLLQEREKTFKEYRDQNRTLISCLGPAVQVLHAFSWVLGETASSVPFPPAKAVFVGIGVLLDAANGVSSSYDTLLDLFECFGSFLKRLEIYTDLPPNPAMTDIIVRILVELLAVLALATKQIKQGRLKKFAKKLLGESEVEAVLQRLDHLTRDEARMTVAQTLGVVHGLVNNVRVVMDDGKVSTDGIRQALVALQQIVNEVNKMKRDQLQRDVQHWLSPPDPSTNHDFVWKSHHKGTAAWFFESNVLADWKSTGSLLWIHGIPGSGKSTLLSAIIQDVEGMRAAGLASMAYYYFDFRDVKKQNRYGLLSSLVSQLSAKSNSCYEVLSLLYSDTAGGTRKPTTSALVKCLKDMLNLQGQGRTYIIIDALDECPDSLGTPSDREEVLELVEELVDLNLPNVHLCVASRPEIDIRMVLQYLHPLQISLQDESGQKDDIIRYIKSVVYSDRKMRNWRDEDRQLVLDVLSQKAGGMFRWVVCQIGKLRRCFSASIRSALADLPETLDETYEQALLGIDKEKRKFAQRLFQCLSVSVRPLRVEEVAEILAVRFDEVAPPIFNPNWRPVDPNEAVLSACSSLISIVEADGSQVVQFSHFSVKEFLTSERLANAPNRLSFYHVHPEPAHTVLAHASLSVLLQLDDSIDRNTIRHLPLAHYAARYWVDHAQFRNVSWHVQDAMERFFDRAKPHFAAWIWLYDIDRHWAEPMAETHPTPPETTPLYYASLCGFRGLVDHLIVAHPLDVNKTGGFHITPLHAASVKGYRDVALLLLENGADLTIRDLDGRVPLHKVSQGGHLVSVPSLLEVARLLLNYCANVNITDKLGWTPLHTAGRNGHCDIAKLLLRSGARLDARNKAQETPLALACGDGMLDVSRFLIDRGSDLNSRNKDGWTPLHSASRYGHIEVARLLLSCGADVNVQEENLSSPLHLASANGHLDIARLLIQHGANIDSQNDKQETPLAQASGEGYLEMARLLIGCGVALSSRDNQGWVPFHKASESGYLHVVKFLLERGVDVDIRNGNEETSLHLASSSGKFDVVRFLIEHGADVHAKDDKDWTPFHKASENGHLHIVTYLLERGVDVNIRNRNERTSLDLASGSGKLDVVRFLIDQGADIYTRDDEGWNAVHMASQNGHLEVVQLLMDTGTAVDVRSRTRKTSLALASSTGKVELCRFLIERGADMNPRDDQGWTPLHFASLHGHVDVTRLLLDRGADSNVQEDDLWSPLHLASMNGHIKVTQLLVQRGATVDMFNDKQQSPLDCAARYGKVEIVLFLIDHGANLHTTDRNGWTPLHSASQSGNLEVVKSLLRRGADVDVLDKADKTAAELAWKSDRVVVASFLAEYKMDESVRDKVLSTTLDTIQYDTDENEKDKKLASLHTASEEGDLDMVKSLLARGADAKAKNASNLTPLDLAATEGNLDVVCLIIEWGAEVDPRDNFGWTPLHKASRYGHLEVSRVLLDNGANVEAKKHDYWTPLHLAARNGHFGIVELLLERGADLYVLNDDGQSPYQLSLAFGHRKIAELLRERMTRGAEVLIPA